MLYTYMCTTNVPNVAKNSIISNLWVKCRSYLLTKKIALSTGLHQNRSYPYRHRIVARSAVKTRNAILYQRVKTWFTQNKCNRPTLACIAHTCSYTGLYYCSDWSKRDPTSGCKWHLWDDSSRSCWVLSRHSWHPHAGAWNQSQEA